MALVQRAIVGMSAAAATTRIQVARRRRSSTEEEEIEGGGGGGGGADARMDNDEYEKMMSEIKRVNEYAERRVRTQTARVTTLPVRPGDEEDASSKEGETPKRGSVVKRASVTGKSASFKRKKSVSPGGKRASIAAARKRSTSPSAEVGSWEYGGTSASGWDDGSPEPGGDRRTRSARRTAG